MKNCRLKSETSITKNFDGYDEDQNYVNIMVNYL